MNELENLISLYERMRTKRLEGTRRCKFATQARRQMTQCAMLSGSGVRSPAQYTPYSTRYSSSISIFEGLEAIAAEVGPAVVTFFCFFAFLPMPAAVSFSARRFVGILPVRTMSARCGTSRRGETAHLKVAPWVERPLCGPDQRRHRVARAQSPTEPCRRAEADRSAIRCRSRRTAHEREAVGNAAQRVCAAFVTHPERKGAQ